MEMVTTASETPYSAIQDGGKEEKNKYAADLEAGGLGDPTSEEALKMVQQYTFREKIVDKIAIFEVCVSLAAVVLMPHAPVMLACGSAMCVAPIVAVTQRELVNVVTLRKTKAALEREVNHLVEENKRLKVQIDALTKTAGRLEDVTEALEETANISHENLKSLAEEVEKMRKIASRIRNRTMNKVWTFFVTAAMKSDIEQTGELTDNEARNLMKRVADLYGVKLNDDKLMKIIHENRDIGYVMEKMRENDDGIASLGSFSSYHPEDLPLC